MITHSEIREYCNSVDRYLDNYELCQKIDNIVARRGMSQGMYHLVNGEGLLTNVCQRHLPDVKDYYLYTTEEITIIAREGFGEILESIWTAIKNFFSRLWKWISGLFGDGSGKTAAEKKTEKVAENIKKSVKVASEKIAKSPGLEKAFHKETNTTILTREEYDKCTHYTKVLFELAKRQIRKLKEHKIDIGYKTQTKIDPKDFVVDISKEEMEAHEFLKEHKPSQHKTLHDAGWTFDSYTKAIEAWSQLEGVRHELANEKKSLVQIFKDTEKAISDHYKNLHDGEIKKPEDAPKINLVLDSMKAVLRGFNIIVKDVMQPFTQMEQRVDQCVQKLTSTVAAL